MLEELNRGGMGVVYKARQLALGRIVALKVIAPEAMAIPNVRERFEREVWASARLNHPNIVTIFDTNLAGQIPFLTMEYVPGIDLLRLVQRTGPLPVPDAVSYVHQAAEGLRHMHEQGLVHRDIKPSNLMVHPFPFEAGTAPRLKILDMGLTRPAYSSQRDAESGLTKAGAFLGTPDFVAPEQVEDSRRADARSDVFSLGSTLYFLLTAEAPFPGNTIAEKVRKMHTEGPPAPSSRRPEVPPALDRVVRKMLAAKPVDRYQSAREVIAALNGCLHDCSVLEASPIASPPKTMSFFDRETSALATLQDAIRTRAAAEAELALNFQTASEKAEREANRTRKQIAAVSEAELSAIDATHQTDAAAIRGRFDSESFALNRGREEKRQATATRFKTAEDKGKAEYKDRLWSLDSLLEGGEKKAKDQLEQLQRKAEAGKELVAQRWSESEAPLARGKVTRARIELPNIGAPITDDDPITAMQKSLDASAASLAELKALPFPKLANFGGLLLCVVLAGGLGSIAFAALDLIEAVAVAVGVGLVLGFGLWLAITMLAHKQTLRVGTRLGEELVLAEGRCAALHKFAQRQYDEELEKLTERHGRKKKETDSYYLPLFAKQKQQYEGDLARIVDEHSAATEDATRRHEAEAGAEDSAFQSRRGEAVAKFDAQSKAAEDAFDSKMSDATADRDDAWKQLADEWRTATGAVNVAIRSLRAAGEGLFPPFQGSRAAPAFNVESALRGTTFASRSGPADEDAPAILDRPLPTTVPDGIRIGELHIDLETMPDAISNDKRLAPPEEVNGPLPVFAPFPDKCSIVMRARDEGRVAGVIALQAAMLRFLTGLPPGKVRFTIIDPVGLGDNFAAFMHLADYDEKLVTGRIWTEPREIEARLADLTDHIASVIQKYLRNQYKSIEEYNRAAGEVAEPYRVLVVANFPTNFTPEAAKRLVSIVNSGPSCGVCTLVSVDSKLTMPRDFTMADLEAPSFTLNWTTGAAGGRGRFVPKDPVLAPFPLSLDMPPDPAVLAKLVQRVGQAGKDAVRVEVPFDYIAPKPSEYWTSSAAKSFDIPVGRAGATRRQVFSLGRGTAQHALIAGKTGSGKSTLLHALITNLGLMYSPDEAELYLVDFKEGVEFQWYATYNLPHARVVAIQSEREFGLSVLQRLDAILRERGEKFRDAGCNDLAGYREAKPNEKSPRILLVVDEFQMFFVEDDKLAQEAALLLDRLVRQGRAFGMHVLLGSQTLGGAYSLARSTIDQMAVRVALQCSDADAQMILSKDNNAARLLSRPGEAIYNDQNGLVEGNDPFQVVWLSEEKREELLKGIGERSAGKYPPPLVFEGNSAADPARNAALVRALKSAAEAKVPLAWLGDPVAIKDPTVAAFRPQGAANLLLLGQNEDAARGLFAASLLGLAAQVKQPHTAAWEGEAPAEPRTAWEGEAPAEPRTQIRREDGSAGASPSQASPSQVKSDSHAFTVADGTPDDSDDAEYLRKLAARLPQGAACPDRNEMNAALGELAAEVERRQKGETADRSPRFLFVFGVHRFRELRKADDEFGFKRGGDREATPAERFAAIIKDGPPLGIHTVVWCDSLTNANRAFDRPLMREFGQRVLFQMSPTDSSTLMDSPAASRLGRNRALYLQEEQERPEKFRPYGLPDPAWLKEVFAAG